MTDDSYLYEVVKRDVDRVVRIAESLLTQEQLVLLKEYWDLKTQSWDA